MWGFKDAGFAARKGSVTEAGKRPRGSHVSQMRRQLVDINNTGDVAKHKNAEYMEGGRVWSPRDRKDQVGKGAGICVNDRE